MARAAELLRNGDADAAMAVPLEPPEPEGMRERNTWESVIAAAMERDELDATAIEAMRAAQEWPVHMRHLYEIGEAFWWKDVVPQIDDLVRQRLRRDDYLEVGAAAANPKRPRGDRRHRTRNLTSPRPRLACG